jgi:prepilin-type N-terminal cleavage/methylation domain-containing protein
VKHRSRGVTLIEMLIAVSLLSLLVAGILIAMHLGLNAMQKANAKLMANRRAVRVQEILEQQIEGFMPEVADCFRGPETPPARIPFFQGQPQSMRFVSSYSLTEAARGYPRILEFQVIAGEHGDGVRLVVNERLYTGPAGAGMLCLGYAPDPATGTPVPQFRPIEIGPGSFVLADRLAFCRFLYRQALPPPALERWVPAWVLPQWPTAVRIEINAPVHVNRVFGEQYVD